MKEIINQLLIIMPTIIVSTTIITGVINGAFNVTKGNVKHIISWIVAVLCGISCVLLGDLSFGFGNYDYLIGGIFGLFAGGASNGLYDWSAIANAVDKLYLLFGNGETLKNGEEDETRD